MNWKIRLRVTRTFRLNRTSAASLIHFRFNLILFWNFEIDSIFGLVWNSFRFFLNLNENFVRASGILILLFSRVMKNLMAQFFCRFLGGFRIFFTDVIEIEMKREKMRKWEWKRGNLDENERKREKERVKG